MTFDALMGGLAVPNSNPEPVPEPRPQPQPMAGRGTVPDSDTSAKPTKLKPKHDATSPARPAAFGNVMSFDDLVQGSAEAQHDQTQSDPRPQSQPHSQTSPLPLRQPRMQAQRP